MSETPKTDAAKIACGFQAVPELFLEHARELERKNAMFRANWKIALQCYTDYKNEALALRSDQVRLDWLATEFGGYWAVDHLEHEGPITRKAIDEAIESEKEAHL